MKPQEQFRQPAESALQRALWGGLILVLIGVAGAGTWSLVRERMAAMRASADRSSRLPVYGSVPDFSLIERSGRRVERSALLGKIWVVNFMYTHCSDTCPLQSAEMARLQADLATEPDVRLVSITVDPKRDTPQVLSRYADRFRANKGRWLFLTGEREAIYRLAQDGLYLPVSGSIHGVRLTGITKPKQDEPDRSAGSAQIRGALGRALEPSPAIAAGRTPRTRVLHASRFVLIDRNARIRNYYDSTDLDSLRQLRQDVKALLQEE